MTPVWTLRMDCKCSSVIVERFEGDASDVHTFTATLCLIAQQALFTAATS